MAGGFYGPPSAFPSGQPPAHLNQSGQQQHPQHPQHQHFQQHGQPPQRHPAQPHAPHPHTQPSVVSPHDAYLHHTAGGGPGGTGGLPGYPGASPSEAGAYASPHQNVGLLHPSQPPPASAVNYWPPNAGPPPSVLQSYPPPPPPQTTTAAAAAAATRATSANNAAGLPASAQPGGYAAAGAYPGAGVSGRGGSALATQMAAAQKQRSAQLGTAAVASSSSTAAAAAAASSSSLGVKDEGGNDLDDDDDDDGRRKGAGGQKGTSDFVKKLFKMLDDTSYAHIVGWSHTGDSFIVRDMNDFTRHVLPRHFRHSNFASFVRQLNKYDFHKVKNPEEQGQGTDQIWEFKHPEFVRGREDLLENVKRKVPTGKKAKGADGRDVSPTMPGAADAAEKGAVEYAELKEQVANLTASQDQMTSHINNLTRQYQAVIGEMLTFQRNMVQQDQLMQNLIQYLMNLEADRKVEDGHHPALIGNGAESAFLDAADTSRLIGSFSDVARESFAQMSALARRQSIAPPPGTMSGGGGGGAHDSSTSGTSHHTLTSSRTPASQQEGAAETDSMSPRSVSSLHTPASNPGASMGPPGGGGGGSTAKGKAASTGGGVGLDAAETPSSGGGALFLHPPHLNAEELDESQGLFGSLSQAFERSHRDEHAGLRVYTVGTLQPRSDAAAVAGGSTPVSDARLSGRAAQQRATPVGDEARPFGINVPSIDDLPASMPRLDRRRDSVIGPFQSPSPPPPGEGAAGGGDADSAERAAEHSRSSPTPPGGTSSSNMLRVRRSTYVPGWAVPPRVLVVDDDDVCRKLGSKFLQVFGCAIDVAVDGVNAVNKMNLEKYDLVLMDIVMPNLDGVSATSLIREFDPRTPIISMTSNSAPQELLSYMSSGMNDILPKPFTKDALLSMLEKHLIHLKTVQKMDEIPKSIGLPPVSDSVLQNVLSETATTVQQLGLSGATGSSSGGGGNGNNAAASSAGVGAPPPPLLGHGGAQQLASRALGQAGVGGGAPSSPSRSNSDEDEGHANPLAGMGFSDDEYISMLQNLIAAGSVSDSGSGDLSETVANIVGVARGEGASASQARRKDSTPAALAAVAAAAAAAAGSKARGGGGGGATTTAGMVRKRTAMSDDATAGGGGGSGGGTDGGGGGRGGGGGGAPADKRSRFTELQA